MTACLANCWDKKPTSSHFKLMMFQTFLFTPIYLPDFPVRDILPKCDQATKPNGAKGSVVSLGRTDRMGCVPGVRDQWQHSENVAWIYKGSLPETNRYIAPENGWLE